MPLSSLPWSSAREAIRRRASNAEERCGRTSAGETSSSSSTDSSRLESAYLALIPCHASSGICGTVADSEVVRRRSAATGAHLRRRVYKMTLMRGVFSNTIPRERVSASSG